MALGGLWSAGAATGSQLPEGLLAHCHNRCWPMQPLLLFFSSPGSAASSSIRLCLLTNGSHPSNPSTGEPSKHWPSACPNPPTVPQVPTTNPKLPVRHATTEDRRLHGHSGRAPTRA